MTFTTYDYKAQRWITGGAALGEAERKRRETIALLRGPRGRAFAAYMGRDYEEMLAEFEAE